MNCATSASTTSRSSGAWPRSAAIDVTPRSTNAARDDVVEHGEVGIDVEREPVPGTPTRDLHADGRDLLVGHPHAGEPRLPVCLDPESGEDGDQRVFEAPHVGHDVAQAVAPLGQRDDRVADELAGSVIGDVATPVGVHQLRPDRRRRQRARGPDRPSCPACRRAGARAAAGSRRRRARAGRAGAGRLPGRAPDRANATAASVELVFPVVLLDAPRASRGGTRPRRRRRTRGGPR